MAVQRQMSKYMEVTKQWNLSNHAYKRNQGTTTTLLSMMDRIFQATDESKIATAIATDQTAAFDCVSHELLLKKMRLYNFSTSTLNWMKSYLSFRTQYVAIGCKESEMKYVRQGVPQGSILGLIMYTLYINELAEIANDYNRCNNDIHGTSDRLFENNCEKCGTIYCYADDSTFISTSKKREENQENINKVLDKVKEFLEANRLVMNASKITLIEIMLQQRRSKVKGVPPPP